MVIVTLWAYKWRVCTSHFRLLIPKLGFPHCTSHKECACQCRRHRFNLWVGKIPWSRKRQPAPVFLSGESHGQKSLAGESPWVTKSQTQLSKHTHTHTHTHTWTHTIHPQITPDISMFVISPMTITGHFPLLVLHSKTISLVKIFFKWKRKQNHRFII